MSLVFKTVRVFHCKICHAWRECGLVLGGCPGVREIGLTPKLRKICKKKGYENYDRIDMQENKLSKDKRRQKQMRAQMQAS